MGTLIKYHSNFSIALQDKGSISKRFDLFKQIRKNLISQNNLGGIMKSVILILTMLSISLTSYAVSDPENERALSCVKKQIKSTYSYLNNVTFSKYSLVYKLNNQNFSYLFITDDELKTEVLVIVRDNDIENATVWINSMFPNNIDISGCY